MVRRQGGVSFLTLREETNTALKGRNGGTDRCLTSAETSFRGANPSRLSIPTLTRVSLSSLIYLPKLGNSIELEGSGCQKHRKLVHLQGLHQTSLLYGELLWYDSLAKLLDCN